MKLKLLFFFFVTSMVFSQRRTCGMQQKMQEILSNPNTKDNYQKQQRLFQKNLDFLARNKNANTATNLIIIPVAVHFPEANTANRACLIELAQKQIAILNADFNATNADIANWQEAKSYYPMVSRVGKLNIQFELATKNHPPNTDPYLTNGQPAVTVGYNYGNGQDRDPIWKGYLNFLIKDIGSTLLGHAPLGGIPLNGDAVVMNPFCFGTGQGCVGTSYVPKEPFHLGRTVTHELGHFFNLDHTFASTECPANQSDCATEGDKVCDTPSLTIENYKCPGLGAIAACSPNKALTMNFMDYVDDQCMYMFTQGQEQRSLAYINTILSQFKKNVLGVNTTVNQSKSFAIYPNPTAGDFTLQLQDTIGKNYKLQINDQAGRLIYSTNFETTTAYATQNIPFNNAQAGIYFVILETDTTTIIKKLIIE